MTERAHDATSASETDGKTESKAREFVPITTQEDFDRIVGKRLERAERRIRDEIRGELRGEVESSIRSEYDTKEQERKGEFEKLAEDRRVALEKLQADFESSRKRLTDLEAVAKQEFETAWKQLPDLVRELAPFDTEDDDVDVLARKKWYVDKALPAVAKLKESSDKPKTPGHRPNDPPAKDGGPDATSLLRELRGKVGYAV